MCQKAQANLAKVRETSSTWEFHIPRIDTWGYLAFLLNDKCKMLVLVSMATDEMIRLVSMYPEVMFMDTTASECISFCVFLFTYKII